MDTEQLEDLARAALATGEEEAALKMLAPAADKADTPRLWQFTGLLQRSIDQHADAFRSLTAAARLAPDDASIAHARARVALEAGIDAVALFERALGLAPTNGEVLIGLAAARFALGRGAEAEAELDAALLRSPLWVEGHAQLAQLRSMIGKKDDATASTERAIVTHPSEPRLWTALLNLELSRERFAALDQAITRAGQAGCDQSFLALFEAIAAAEQGQIDRANRLFDALPTKERETIAIWDVRHLIRTGQTGNAVVLIDRELEGPRAQLFWPYASIAWRLTGDPRQEWLEAGGNLVSVLDLADRLPRIDELAALLRSLHLASGEYLDQSVRGGTQTDGPLLSRLEPQIRSLRAAIVRAVEDYRDQLPPIDPRHPLLKGPRDRRIRFAGSWSVRLRSAGFHANHVHPQGWISSALYLALPAQSTGEPEKAGWLKIGEAPPELGVEVPTVRLVEPKLGRLVLFPSWMWHGTTPFAQGERLSVAFDVQRPI